MAERRSEQLWSMRAVYVLLCMALIFLHLLPLDTVPRGWAGPDLMVAITFAWVLRRPAFAPPVLIAVMFLMADLLFQRPPGLWAGLILLGSEALRNRAGGLRDLTFPVEWLNVATVLVAVTLGYRVVLAVLFVDQAPLGLSLMQMLMTLLAYPLVVVVSQVGFGVRKSAPGDLDVMGRRI